jgi:hypothetical protein
MPVHKNLGFHQNLDKKFEKALILGILLRNSWYSKQNK